MDRQYLLGITMALLCWLQGTAQAESPTPASYFPLTVGNRWVYEIVARSDDPSEPEQIGQKEVWKVVRQEEGSLVLEIVLNTEEGTRFEEFLVPTGEGVKRLNIKTKDGGKPADADPSGTQPRFFIKTPITVGTAWKNQDGRYEITAIDETVTVPAGTFANCIEVTNKSESGKVTIVSLYAPGVGVVRRDETFPRPEGSAFDERRKSRATLRLKEWKLAETKQ